MTRELFYRYAFLALAIICSCPTLSRLSLEMESDRKSLMQPFVP